MSPPRPLLRCYYVETVIVHAVVADSARAAETIARAELATTSPFEADRVRSWSATTSPPDTRALDAFPSWRDAEADDDPRRAWTLRRWLRAQRTGR
jgi:hypothetical protein